jgi:hypothetical protein
MLNKVRSESALTKIIPRKALIKKSRIPQKIQEKTRKLNYIDYSDAFGLRDTRERLSSRGFKNVIPSRYVGVEIEMSKAQTDKIASNEWKAVMGYCSAFKDDGSVSGDGIELNTIPARGLAYHKQIEVIGDNLKALGCRADSSCGLHVHIDASDYNGSDTFKLLNLWARIEGQVFKMVKKSRMNGTYCRPMNNNDSRRIIESKHLLENNTPNKVIDRFPPRDGRYHALNTYSFSEHGTFEFRLYHGTTNKTEIALWGMFCSYLVDFAKASTLSKIRSVTAENWIDVVLEGQPLLKKYVNKQISKYNK